MRYEIFGMFAQSGENHPDLIGGFGDVFISLGFKRNADTPGANARSSKGLYTILAGDELGMANNPDVHIQIQIGRSTNAAYATVDQRDTMIFDVRFFDKNGAPVDVDGDFYAKLTLNVPGA